MTAKSRLRIRCRFSFQLIFIFSFFFLSCQQTQNQPTVKPVTDSAAIISKSLAAVAAAEKQLTDGLLITRSDNDFESLFLQNFSKRERSYSHSGIVFKEDGKFVVYHSMAGSENPNGACRRDPFDSFVNPVQKTGFGIFKYDLSASEIVKFHALLKQHFLSKMPFDISFNLQTNDSLYCSEMIYKDLKAATSGRVQLPVSVIYNFRPKIMGYKYNNVLHKKFEYIGIDDLYLNPFCKEIKRVKF